MSENAASSTRLLTAWGADLASAFCARCQTSFLVDRDAPPAACPNCFQSALEIKPDDIAGGLHPYPPELIVPFQLSEQQLGDAIRRFAASIPFPPTSLDPSKLRAGMSMVYVPTWLVDSAVSAYWQAEVGFDYQVISHQETYQQNLGGWKSSEVKEPRVRWENRVGRLRRAYHNVAVPAIEESARPEKQLGAFHMDSAQSYHPDCIRRAAIRVPDRTPQTSWSDAAAAFQKTAAQDCQHACSAGHIRQFRWKARFNRLNWTLMLLPMYTAYYRDDQGKIHGIKIHGQTGAISGSPHASSRRALHAGLLILLMGIILFLAGLLLDDLPTNSMLVETIATLLSVLGISAVLASCAPSVIAWDFNRRQHLEEMRIR